MADRRISELPVIPAVAGDDALAIVDTSLSETNKVSVEDLLRSSPAGTAAAPSIAFVDDPDTGFYRSAANELSISTGGSQRVVVDSVGNVGIGTSSPSRLFEVSGDGNLMFEVQSTGTTATGRFGGTTTGTIHLGADGSNSITGNSTTNRLTFKTSGSEKVRIDSAGNVGIGTSSPGAIFHSNAGTANITGLFESADGNAFIGIKDSNSTTAYGSRFGTVGDSLYLDTQGGSDTMRIDSSGNVGIGTSSPGEKLEVNGTIKATDINFTGLATYADDTAAGTGGLVAGDVYKTSTGELRIKL